ncbi:translation initiation factor IF-5A [Candidatus Micrarchaeota archaeon]|nr:MAG: translation initiation factor IF-5A [Candidatus Micrarchaeota archaeon]
MSDRTFGTMKELKVGKYVIVDDEPCRVVSVESSAPGKHGAAKMRVAAISIFSGNKKTIMKPSDADCEIPVIERKKGQIVSMVGESAQIMDSESFETFELPIPDEMKGEAEAGKNVDYMVALGRKLITRIY